LELAAAQGLVTLNGIPMNLEQAVIACGKALGGTVGFSEIRKIMMAVK
jgi:shikimate 5-dehydrogenase